MLEVLQEAIIKFAGKPSEIFLARKLGVFLSALPPLLPAIYVLTKA